MYIQGLILALKASPDALINCVPLHQPISAGLWSKFVFRVLFLFLQKLYVAKYFVVQNRSYLFTSIRHSFCHQVDQDRIKVQVFLMKLNYLLIESHTDVYTVQRAAARNCYSIQHLSKQ